MEKQTEVQASELKMLIDELVSSKVELAILQQEKQQEYSSDQLAPLYEALAKAQSEFQAPKKNQTVKVQTKSGGSYTFKYGDLTSIIEATRPALNANGLSIRQEEVYNYNNGKAMVGMRTILSHKTGVSIEQLDAPLAYDMNSAQSARSTTSYLRRYGMTNMLGLAAEDDDDNNIASGNHFEYVGLEDEVVDNQMPLQEYEDRGQVQQDNQFERTNQRPTDLPTRPNRRNSSGKKEIPF